MSSGLIEIIDHVVAVVALAAAIGGGTIHGLLPGVRPVSWMVDPWQRLAITVLDLIFACQPIPRIGRLTGNPIPIRCTRIGMAKAGEFSLQKSFTSHEALGKERWLSIRVHIDQVHSRRASSTGFSAKPLASEMSS